MIIELIALNFILIGILLFLNIQKLNSVLREVKKGNKDQQEIKTRLTWSKKREKKLLKN